MTPEMREAGANVLWHSGMTEYADLPGLATLAEQVYTAMEARKPVAKKASKPKAKKPAAKKKKK